MEWLPWQMFAAPPMNPVAAKTHEESLNVPLFPLAVESFAVNAVPLGKCQTP
jgi:hypothetical protein